MRDQHLLDRLQRADSWMKAASSLNADQMHEAFIFFYIAFNCLYGRRKYEGDEAHIGEDLGDFFKKIILMHEKDVAGGGSVLTEAVGACRRDGAVLIRDRFLDNRYWRRSSPPPLLQNKLNEEARTVLAQVDDGSYQAFLGVAFRRISVLRNQVMHGCATYGPRSFGRASLAKGLRFLRVTVPAFYRLVFEHGHEVRWDPIPYPRLGSQQPRG
jgi:hypothetical protein